eukprot:3281290-Rhodomonas_salina.1
MLEIAEHNSVTRPSAVQVVKEIADSERSYNKNLKVRHHTPLALLQTSVPRFVARVRSRPCAWLTSSKIWREKGMLPAVRFWESRRKAQR